VAAQRIADLGPLPNQQITPAKHHRRRLLGLDLTATNRMLGRWAASQIASASAASFFWRLTNGLT